MVRPAVEKRGGEAMSLGELLVSRQTLRLECLLLLCCRLTY